MTPSMLTEALAAAARGWPVFPLHTTITGSCSCRTDCGKQAGKHPRTRHGLHDATTDAAVIRAWWAQWPEANIGARTGITFDMLDIDHDDPHLGTDDWPELVDMPGGPVVRTGGGWHFYVAPTGRGNRARFTEHCDWRGDGGYAILPPSLHHSGARYRWHSSPDLALHPAPTKLLEVLDPKPAPAPTLISRATWTPSPGRWNPSGLIERLATAPEGSRNATLVWAANRLGLDLFAGKAERAAVDAAVDALYDAALSIGLTERETKATIRSGFAKGVRGMTNRDRIMERAS